MKMQGHSSVPEIGRPTTNMETTLDLLRARERGGDGDGDGAAGDGAEDGDGDGAGDRERAPETGSPIAFPSRMYFMQQLMAFSVVYASIIEPFG